MCTTDFRVNLVRIDSRSGLREVPRLSYSTCHRKFRGSKVAEEKPKWREFESNSASSRDNQSPYHTKEICSNRWQIRLLPFSIRVTTVKSFSRGVVGSFP
jgi:hypothetical protein